MIGRYCKTSKLTNPFFLSGGIGPGDVDKIKMFQNSFVAVVDVNSRFETTPGIKDIQAVSQFVKTLKAQ